MEGAVGHDFDVVLVLAVVEGEAVVDPFHLRDRSARRLEVQDSCLLEGGPISELNQI